MNRPARFYVQLFLLAISFAFLFYFIYDFDLTGFAVKDYSFNKPVNLSFSCDLYVRGKLVDSFHSGSSTKVLSDIDSNKSDWYIHCREPSQNDNFKPLAFSTGSIIPDDVSPSDSASEAIQIVPYSEPSSNSPLGSYSTGQIVSDSHGGGVYWFVWIALALLLVYGCYRYLRAHYDRTHTTNSPQRSYIPLSIK